MTDEQRTEEINVLLGAAVIEMVGRGLLDNEVAAWRAILVAGFHKLPELLCAEHLRSDLQRFHNWLSKDLEHLARTN